jgi:subtilisin family serine protease
MSGNTFGQANFISINSVISDSVDFFDLNDYWFFTLSEARDVEIELANLSSDADVELYDGFQRLIDFSENAGSSSETISSQLSAGTYYIRVFPYYGDYTGYSLLISADASISDEAGNSLDSARVISVGSSTSFFNDAVSFADSNDYYRFTLNSPSLFELNLTDLSSDADVEILDSNGNYIDSSTLSGSQSENIVRSLNSGTYYINVYPYIGETAYTLAVSAEPENVVPPDNAGNNIGNASPIDLNSSRSDAVGDFDESDYYRLDLTSGSEVAINLTGLLSDIDIELLDSNGNYINSSVNGGINSETITAQLDAGTYYIHVFPWSGGSNYNLTITGEFIPLPPPPDPNQPNQYSSTTGYGFADASAAVARAINQNPFPDVPTFGGANDWNVNMVNAPEVWAQGYTGQGIVVAVLDTGVDRNHPDLSRNIWSNAGEVPGDGIDNDNNGYIDDVFGWNFVEDKNNTLDVFGHGTHVSGTIAGLNNGTGVVGIAYDAQIMPVKVLGDDGSGSYEGISRGIYYAVENGASVINLSLGGGSGNQALQSAINYASENGVVVVMAAGNEGESQPGFPARYATDDGIAIGAVSNTNNIADFSNRSGPDSSMVYVTNPGVSVYSALPGGTYESWNGTSMATPHAAGIVALMLDANPSITDAQARQILISTTTDSPTISSFIGSQSSRVSVAAKPLNVFSDGSVVTPPDGGDSSTLLSRLDTTLNRFRNNDRPGTYLFAGAEESSSIRQNYNNFIEEGPAFQVATTQSDPLLQPFYRFQNSAPGREGTYLFAGAEEAASIRQNYQNFIEEGVAFYAYSGGIGGGTTEFSRFQNNAMPGTYLFAGPEESAAIINNPSLGFTYEGIAFAAGG